MKALFLFVKVLAEFFEKLCVILLVLGTETVSRTCLAWVLPIDIETVQLVVLDKFHRTLDEQAATLFGESHIGEIARSRPSADRDEHRQRWVLLLEGDQRG